MLPGIRCLFHCERGFAFHDESIKILTQKNRYRFGKRPCNVRFDLVYLIENRERLILEDGICVKNKKPGFHNCKANVGQEPRRNQGKRPSALTSANPFAKVARHSHSARSRGRYGSALLPPRAVCAAHSFPRAFSRSPSQPPTPRVANANQEFFHGAPAN